MPKTYEKENPDTIRSLFNHIAKRYDLANSLLSFHTHAIWNQKIAREIVQKASPSNVLDLCSGTGDIAIRILHYAAKNKYIIPDVHLVDFSSEMLKIAKLKAAHFAKEIQDKMIFQEADVTALTYPDNSFDAATCAYGIRNVKNVPLFFQQVYRTLKPQGHLAILELTRPKNVFLKAAHDLYIRTCIPIIGKLLTSDKEAYGYLQESIRAFISPDNLAASAKDAGFKNIQVKSLSGGIATLFYMQKQAKIGKNRFD